MLEFERLETTGLLATPVFRSRIPGGWLVVLATGICFVPDPGHGWDGRSLPS